MQHQSNSDDIRVPPVSLGGPGQILLLFLPEHFHLPCHLPRVCRQDVLQICRCCLIHLNCVTGFKTLFGRESLLLQGLHQGIFGHLLQRCTECDHFSVLSFLTLQALHQSTSQTAALHAHGPFHTASVASDGTCGFLLSYAVALLTVEIGTHEMLQVWIRDARAEWGAV